MTGGMQSQRWDNEGQEQGREGSHEKGRSPPSQHPETRGVQCRVPAVATGVLKWSPVFLEGTLFVPHANTHTQV